MDSIRCQKSRHVNLSINKCYTCPLSKVILRMSITSAFFLHVQVAKCTFAACQHVFLRTYKFVFLQSVYISPLTKVGLQI